MYIELPPRIAIMTIGIVIMTIGIATMTIGIATMTTDTRVGRGGGRGGATIAAAAAAATGATTIGRREGLHGIGVRPKVAPRLVRAT